MQVGRREAAEAGGERSAHGRFRQRRCSLLLARRARHQARDLAPQRQVRQPTLDFYPYNPLTPDVIWQAHEGDWEVVNVALSRQDEEPLYVGYSQHCNGRTRAWSQTPRWRGHHPVVYVALGSHANYFTQGEHVFDEACLPAPVLAFFAQTGLPLPRDQS